MDGSLTRVTLVTTAGGGTLPGVLLLIGGGGFVGVAVVIGLEVSFEWSEGVVLVGVGLLGLLTGFGLVLGAGLGGVATGTLDVWGGGVGGVSFVYKK